MDNLDQLVDDWVAQVRTIETYLAGQVNDEEMRTTARKAFQLILALVAGHQPPEDVQAVSRESGRKRALQKVPLEAVLMGTRLDFRIVWAALLAHAEPADTAELLGSATRVWEAVERHVTDIMDAYHTAVSEISQQREDYRRNWFTRLISEGEQRPDVIDEVSRALGLHVDAKFVAVFADSAYGVEFRHIVDRLATEHIVCHQQPVSSGIVLVVELPRRPGTQLVDILKNVRCGISPVLNGMVEIPEGIRLAEATLRALPKQAHVPCRLEDAWLRVIAAQSPDISRRLVEEVFGSLRATRAAEYSMLLSTVEAYLTDQSLAATAASLYCHRNTVLNRLNRFHELTGKDLRIPRDASVVWLALQVRDVL